MPDTLTEYCREEFGKFGIFSTLKKVFSWEIRQFSGLIVNFKGSFRCSYDYNSSAVFDFQA